VTSRLTRRQLLRFGAVAAAAACSAPVTSAPVTSAPDSPAPQAPTPAPPPSPTSPPPPAPTPAPAPVSAPLEVPIYCREAWGALPPAGEAPQHRVERLTVHHAAVPLENLTDGPVQLRSFQRFHMQDRGWPDIAYHVGVDRAGHVYALRSPDRVGDTATDYDPTTHFLLLCQGDFDRHDVSADQFEAAARVLAWAAATFEVPVDTISGHRDHARTSCPGDRLHTRLPELTDRARALIADGGVALVEVCGEPGTAAVAAIETGGTPPA
jgi:hypothetical protein